MNKNASNKNVKTAKKVLPAKKAAEVKQRAKTRMAKRFARTKREDAGDKIMKMAGAHGTNALDLKHREVSQESLAAVNQDVIYNLEPATTSTTVQNVALGILLAAKKRGINTQVSPDVQFQAYGYICDVLRASIKGVTLDYTSAPRWFVELCAGLRPKEKNSLTSKAYYEMVIAETSPALGPLQVLGTADETYAIIFGSSNGTPFNGFSSIVPAAAYDPLLGKEAFSTLWSVFPAKPGTPSELISPTMEKAYNSKDCSAFAIVSSRLGTGFFTPGGVNNRLENEVHIDSPIMAKFCSDNEVTEDFTSPYRAGFNYANGGGTSCYIGPRCLEFTEIDQFRNKARAVFKFYDFNRFYEQFALIIGGVQERAYKQNAITPRPYPLSVQRFQIMLRQTLLPFFNNEMAQDLRLKNASGLDGGIVKYLPFTVCDNGVSQTAAVVSPLVPSFFNECIKGCMRIKLDVSGQRGVKGRQTLDFVPILAIPPQQGRGNNYTWSNGVTSGQVFLDPIDEVLVNLLDCSLVDGSSTFYLNLNGTELSAYVEAHNEWMTEMQPFLTGLCKATPSEGSPLFASVVYTQIVRDVLPLPVVGTTVNTPVSIVLTKQPSVKAVKGASMASSGKVRQVNPIPTSGIIPFTQQAVVSSQSSVPYFQELEKYQSIMIQPEVRTINAEAYATARSYLQGLYGEFISIPYGASFDDNTSNNSTNLPNLFTIHSAAADLDLKNITGSGLSEIEQVLENLNKDEGGGFLSILSKALTGAGALARAADGMF